MFIVFVLLVCFLLVVGFFVTNGQSPVGFAISSLVVLGALAFLGLLLMVLYVLITSH